MGMPHGGPGPRTALHLVLPVQRSEFFWPCPPPGATSECVLTAGKGVMCCASSKEEKVEFLTVGELRSR
jgi:hypothetical protein